MGLTQEEARAEAVRRIAHARDTGAKVLDLGDLGLKQLPEEIRELRELRVLALGEHQAVREDGKWEWEWDRDRPGLSQLADVSPLGELTNLTALNLFGCRALWDVSPLGALTNLTTLNLGACNVSDASPLGKLTNLTALNLFGCKVSDVSPLGKLTNLTTLNLTGCKVSDVSPLAVLTNLIALDLASCYELSDVTPLGKLTKLTTLNLTGCRALSDVSPLAALTNLTILKLGGCAGLSSFRPLRPLLTRLTELTLYSCNFGDLHPAVFGSSSSSNNVVDKVRAYYTDLDAGAEADAEVKLFVLGNGRVGKTQLVRRLRKQPYDDRVPTTHGVEWHSFRVEAEAADGSALPVNVNLWDFGGQDIYHGSHALFLDRHAVFVVLWHPDFESGTTVEHGTTMTNHPLAYWLDCVRAAAGPDAVVLLVQARADTRHDEHPLPDIDTGDLTIRHTVFSAKTGRGFGALQAQIEDAVRDLIGARPPQLIGRGRFAVRNRLRAMLAEDQARPKTERRHRVLTEADFQTICDEEGGVSSAAALLTFLHRTGVVFHSPNLFRGQIILDQQWALDAIYTLLDRARVVPLLRALHGRFTRAEIEGAVWGEYTPDEQRSFLGMMRECDICFESGYRNEETLYTAPELLPDEGVVLGALVGLLPEGEAPVSATARFRFLHDGIVRGLLAGVGRVTREKGHFWRTGCYFFDEATRSRILVDVLREPANEAEPASGTIRLRGWGPDPGPVLDALVRELDRVRGRQEPHIERLWSPSQERRAPDVEPRANPLSVLRPGPLPAGDRVAAISYGHGDEHDDNGRRRGAFVDGLEIAMRDWGFRPLRDVNELANCGQIREFVPTICATRRVVLVLTDKYLRSVPCMTELHAVFVEARQRRDTFASLVVPCVLEDLPGLGFADDEGRVAWREHWEREYERRAAHVRKYGRDDLNQWYDIGQWAHLVPDMLAFVANMVADRGYEALTANGFAAVKRMLDRPRPGG